MAVPQFTDRSILKRFYYRCNRKQKIKSKMRIWRDVLDNAGNFVICLKINRYCFADRIFTTEIFFCSTFCNNGCVVPFQYSFRITLDTYFGTSYGSLPDRSYFSTWGRPYSFVEVLD